MSRYDFNVLRYQRRSTAGTAKSEAEEAHGFAVGLVAFGTGAFFLESLVYIVYIRRVGGPRFALGGLWIGGAQ